MSAGHTHRCYLDVAIRVPLGYDAPVSCRRETKCMGMDAVMG